MMVLMMLNSPAQAQESEWQEIKGHHFVVYYGPSEDLEAARQVLRKAEEYYRKIGDQIGYTRYSNFWTWDERVRIFMFHDQESFIHGTGQPVWIAGYVDRDAQLFESYTIMTYKQEENFYDGLLPHEISHLIMRDFISPPQKSQYGRTPDRPIPVWLDEGVAQLQETYKYEIAEDMMRVLVHKGQHIPFEMFVRWDIRTEKEPVKIKAFYAQSLMVVRFLINTYGSSVFGRFCRSLRDGKTLEEALRSAYSNRILSVPELEKKWIQFMGGRSF